MLSIKEILEIITAVDQSSISRLELEQDATRLVISKGGETVPLPVKATTVPQDTASAAPEQKTEPAGCENRYQQILAPMLGTFYAAPEPGAPAFVAVGQKITADSMVCVLEAMKLFNEVEAGMAGEVMEVLVKDGEFVEYGQPLFLVNPI